MIMYRSGLDSLCRYRNWFWKETQNQLFNHMLQTQANCFSGKVQTWSLQYVFLKDWGALCGAAMCELIAVNMISVTVSGDVIWMTYANRLIGPKLAISEAAELQYNLPSNWLPQDKPCQALCKHGTQFFHVYICYHGRCAMCGSGSSSSTSKKFLLLPIYFFFSVYNG